MAKTMSLTDLGTLKKIMGMTTSQHDGEALSALRKANAILAKYQLSWAEVLDRTTQQVQTVAQPAGRDGGFDRADDLPLKVQIERAFDEIRGTVQGSFAAFIDSIEKQFKETGYLSPAQREPLFKAVRNHRERRRRDE